MPVSVIPELPFQPVFSDIASGLREQGYAIVRNSTTEQLALALLQQIQTFSKQEFHPAGTGRQDQHQLNPFVRRDKIRWLSPDTPAEQNWLACMAGLQQHLNRQLLLGLFSYECHFAHYQPGDFYRKHLDAFKGQANRILSSVLYLNPDWNSHCGGELVLFRNDYPEQELLRQSPTLGTLVCFLSEEFPHEVLAAERDRYSIAGWFRLNGSHHHRVDPPR